MDSKILTVNDLGKAIREARKQQALTQDDLAGMTGTGSEIENTNSSLG